MMLANLGGLYSAGKSGLQSLISSLFGQGQQGLLFVPQPLLEGEQTLYQLDNGTTLTDANGDPVGLGLEFSQGLERGPELVTNGTFDTDVSNWGTNFDSGLVEWVSGQMRFYTDGPEGFPSIYGDMITLEVGKYYKLELPIVSVTSDITDLQIQLATTVGIDAPETEAVEFGLVSTAMTASAIFYADEAYNKIRIFDSVGAAGATPDVLIDNVTVRELPGNHLTQSVSADRPTYNTDGSLHWLAHDGAGDNLKSTYASPVAQPCTLSVAIDKQDAGTDKVIATGLSSTDRHQISINASGNLVAIAGSTTLDSGQALANGKHIVTVVLDGANSSIRVDGASIATGDLGADSSGGLTLSSLWDGTLSIVQDVYGAIHAEGVDDVGRVESYLNDRIGGNVL